MRFLVSGSLAYDRIMNFPGVFSDYVIPEKAHTLNVSFLVQNLKESFGGNAGNIAFNLALLGEKAAPVGTAGKDFTPYKEWLERAGVDTSLIHIATDEPTAFASIITDSKDNQITAFYPGAMGKSYVIGEDLWKDEVIGIIAPGNPDDMRRLPQAFREKGVAFMYDPGQQIPTLSADDLKTGMEKASAVIANDYELAMILKKTGWNENQILQHADMLITTLGEKGSRIRTPQETIEIMPATPNNMKDPTGAGDAYRAGLLYGFVRQWPLKVSGQFASVVACYTIETYGTQTHTFTFDDVRLRYEATYKEVLPNK